MTKRNLISATLLSLIIIVAFINPGWAQRREVSLRQLEEAIKNNPEDSRLYYMRGLKYQNEGDNQKALQSYQKAVNLNPKYPEALLRLGALKFQRGDQDGAIKTLTKVIQLDPKSQEAKTFLGVVYGSQGMALLQQGKSVEAAKVLQLAVRYNPEDDVALNNLGVAFAAQENLALAAQAFQQAIRENPANDKAQFNLGYTYLRMGDKTGALSQYGALTTLGSAYGGELFALISYPKGYPVDTPYSQPQWGQTRPYKALPAAEFPSSPSPASVLRDNPDLQIPTYRSSLPEGQPRGSDLGREPGLQTPSYKSSMPAGRLPGSQEK